ncbi:chymotrypsin inhibitor [Ilyonectria destructans]|nr:chymotrypsin inhibitor [Ilyonectria destructans]
MKLSSVIFLLITAVVASPLQEKRTDCPENSVYTQCGTACPLRCGKPPPKFCTLQCVERCQCLRGLLLNSSGSCVPPTSC